MLGFTRKRLFADSNVSTSAGAGSLQTVKVSITAVQLQTADVTPIELVPTPGAGKIINPTRVLISYTKGDGLLTFTNIIININQSNITLYDWPLGLESSKTLFIALMPVEVATTTVVGTIARQYRTDRKLELAVNTPSAVGTGTMDVYVTYEIITL